MCQFDLHLAQMGWGPTGTDHQMLSVAIGNYIVVNQYKRNAFSDIASLRTLNIELMVSLS